MIPEEVLRTVRRIQVRAGRLVNDVFAGEYSSAFKGRGMEFEEVREYTPGDDVRSIDWNVTARSGRPHVKLYREERELRVMLLVDLSSSGAFGTALRRKRDLATEVSALIAFSAIHNNDKVGLLLFTDRIERYIPPKKGKTHVLRVIREVLHFRPHGSGTDIPLALDYLGKVCRKRTVAFLISDYQEEGFEKSLRIANRRHELVAVPVGDPREVELPDCGLVELEDAESGERVLVDTSHPEVRRAFRTRAAGALNDRRRLFQRLDVDAVPLWTNESYAQPLMRFFRERERRRSR